MARLALLLACVLGAAEPPAADTPADSDALYAALLGDAQPVEAEKLVDAPGRFVGRAVRTQARLERATNGDPAFELSVGRSRVRLRLEPQAAALLASRADAWLRRPVEVEGFFYREAEAATEGVYALRAWRVRGLGEPPRPPGVSAAVRVTLEALVYGAGSHDGKLVRVSGSYRGSNLQHDLPEPSRKSSRDWVLKDGYFAVWVGEREAQAAEADLDPRAADSDLVLEVVGVPTTSKGVVRIAARQVEVSLAPLPGVVVGRALATGDAGWAAVPPHLSFSLPVPGETLRPRGQVVLQFNKPMDPARFEACVRVRYERRGVTSKVPRVRLDYRDRYRALVLTPEPPPPPGSELVVELLDGLVDVDGRALTPPAEPLRFRSAR